MLETGPQDSNNIETFSENVDSPDWVKELLEDIEYKMPLVPSLNIDLETKTIRVSNKELDAFPNQDLTLIKYLKKIYPTDGWTIIHT